MRILLLAPEPFYQVRGTPVAVDLLLRVLSERGDAVDVLTYAEGEEVAYPGVAVRRIPALRLLRGIRPGFSLRKVLADLLLLGSAVRLARARRHHLVHAVEEAVFIARVLKLLYGLPYLYDMDSLLSEQLLQRYRLLRPLAPVLAALEGVAIRNAAAVVAVCEGLARRARALGAARVHVLRDVALQEAVPGAEGADLRAEVGADGPIVLYVGNLEPYQGIDLLLESFARARRRCPRATLAVVGGTGAAIGRYREVARGLGIGDAVRFLGPRHPRLLGSLLGQADVLVSPRIGGANTPMKIYSYLRSGTAVLATDIPAHTEVLDGRQALLAPPQPAAFAEALATLLGDAELRRRLGEAARQRFERDFSSERYREAANAIFDGVAAELGAPAPAAGGGR